MTNGLFKHLLKIFFKKDIAKYSNLSINIDCKNIKFLQSRFFYMCLLKI